MTHENRIPDFSADDFSADDYLFGHLKLRFRYPHTRRFQVLTRDSIRLYSLLQSKPLDELSSRKPISKEEAEVFCELSKLLLKIF